MFRKLVLAALIAAGAAGGLTATAFAQPPVAIDRYDHGHYRVLVRHRLHWDTHGTYRDRDDAQRAARRLERQGFDTRIERVRGW
jgi:hypothetical protein